MRKLRQSLSASISPQHFADPVLSFAVEELKKFLLLAGVQVTDPEKKGQSLHISLVLDSGLPPAAFSFVSEQSEGSIKVRLSGADSTCVLHAVYTFLEQAGFRFDITGTISPEVLSLSKWPAQKQFVRPSLTVRGIRQHLNFPMDCSSYSLVDAKEYIRRLARLRFNHITFHSYGNQWIPFPASGAISQAGFFFYGQKHVIPEIPWLQAALHNQKVFCIPEIEPFFDDKEERSRLAITWLREVMAEAKRVGLSIQFSYEPRRTSQDVTRTIQECATILETYPDIEVLELITQETGRWGEIHQADQVRQIVEVHFGLSALSDESLSRLLAEPQPGLGNLLGEIGHNIKAASQLTMVPAVDRPYRLCLGVYCVIEDYLPACLSLLKRAAPENVAFAFLTGHGSRQAARNTAATGFTPADRRRTLLYSWLEFDGLMFLQQNSVQGIQDILEQNGFRGVCFNHWRTAENRVAARYASQATIYEPIPESEFYLQEAAHLKISKPAEYAAGMRLVGKADALATLQLPNIGFCYVGVWGEQGLGAFSWWDSKKLVEVLNLYRSAQARLQECRTSTPRGPGKEQLAFLVNRVNCSILYLEAIQTALKLQPLLSGRSPMDMSPATRTEVSRICNQALSLLRRYMRKHMRSMPDRGCEGTLISVFYTPMSVLRRIRAQYGSGAPDPWPIIYESSDAPPPPEVPQ